MQEAETLSWNASEAAPVSRATKSFSAWHGMRILFDARKFQHGGIGTYLENILFGLLQHQQRSALEISVVVNSDQKLPDFLAKNFNLIVQKAKPHSLAELFSFANGIDQNRFDLFHTPHIVLPFDIRIPSIVTVHDLIHITHPEKFFYPALSRLIISSSIKRAKQVLTVSRASAQQIAKYFAESNKKLSIVPNAISDHIRSNTSSKVQGKFILGVFSNQKAHKGLSDLLTAWKSVVDRGLNSGARLLLAGQGFAQSKNLPLNIPKLEVRGAVSDSELSQLYTAAHALVVPSLVEGFCLPALEAHACGTVVIMRPEAALNELATEQDFVADDWKVASLESCIVQALALPKRIWSDSASLRSDYSAQNIATQILDVYCKACMR